MVTAKEELEGHSSSFCPLPCLLPAAGAAQGGLCGVRGLLSALHLLSDRKRTTMLKAAQGHPWEP